MAYCGVLLIVFLWGPKKLPELARSIGLAKEEFETVAKETRLDVQRWGRGL